jgi:ribonuclease I
MQQKLELLNYCIRRKYGDDAGVCVCVYVFSVSWSPNTCWLFLI